MDAEFSARYLDYQSLCPVKIRESDLIRIDPLRSIRGQESQELWLLYFGCSNGNFLAHLCRLVPGMELFGIDSGASAIEQCSASPELVSVRCRFRLQRGVTPFFRSKSDESRLVASLGWQEEYEHHDKKEKTAFA